MNDLKRDANGSGTPPVSGNGNTTASSQKHAFDVLGFTLPTHGTNQGANQGTSSSTTAATTNASGTGQTGHIAQVSSGNRMQQYAAFAEPNAQFRGFLTGHGLQVVPNPGRGNNCAIYALVQHAAPSLKGPALDREVNEIRQQFNQNHPDEKGNMLLLDGEHGGHAAELISMVNQRHNVDMAVGVVQAGIEAAHPATQLGVYEGNGSRAPGSVPSHRVVVWDQGGHFEAIKPLPQTGSRFGVTTPASAKPSVKPQVKFTPDTKKQASASISGTKTTASTSTAKAGGGSGNPLSRFLPLGARRLSSGTRQPPSSASSKSAAFAPLSFTPDNHDDLFKDVPHIDHASLAQAAKTPKVSNGPGFIVPSTKSQPGQAFDRSKPGFTAVEVNGIRPYGNLFNAFAASSHGDQATDLAITGISVGGAHEVVAGGFNGHALFASGRKRERYGRQLSSMLAQDVQRFKDNPNQETLILTRDKKGQLTYDLPKVAKLAASDNPKYADEIAHAKNVLLTAYIKDEVAGKRHNRALYELGRNTLGVTSAALLVAGTHGLAAAAASAPAIATKQAGLGIGMANALDVGKGVRGVKQRIRDSKQQEINNDFLRRRLNLQPGDIPDDIPDEALDGIHASMRDNARVDAGAKVFGKIFPGSIINEQKSLEKKGELGDQVAAHALNVVDYHVDQFAARGLNNLEELHRTVHRPGASLRDKEKALSASIKGDPDLRTAYDLLRDLGMRRSEATAAIQNVVVRKIETRLATDPAKPAGSATAAMKKKAAETQSGDPDRDDVAAMKEVMARR
ncbi:hypothetical protein [Paraburkholderia ginsengiterrae]|uniref:Uncharacterized protein n=1 Tax=Paraburkholderia ginsengiterrae TaxID=1462993 RepID=A0A1A9NAE9_9BURK|nr:hypothetical protein [Paraburkholderia ginsengiterrae]OAJ62877.1 hypothetical protein A6V37_21945 [Paraburkholderia ginsengiterrae]